MTYRSESEALRARADSLEQDLQRQKVEVAEGRAAKAKAKALEQELAAARAKLAKLERRQTPKPGASSPKIVALVLGIVSLMAAGAMSFVFMRAPVERPIKSPPAIALPTPPVKPELVPPRPQPRTTPATAVRVPSSAPSGTLGRNVIQRVVSQHMRSVQFCYERELLKYPGLNGKIVVDWTIGTHGGVTAAKVGSSTLASKGVARCVLRRIRSWRFPAPRGGSVQIRYPFVFRSQGGGAPSPPKPAAGYGRGGADGLPTVRLGTPSTAIPKSGELSGELVRRQLRRHIREIKACYEPLMVGRAPLHGKLVLEWTIALDGTVKAAKLASSTFTPPAGLISCVLGKVRSWRYPRPAPRAIVVRYPFLFTTFYKGSGPRGSR